ncbi:hypothetical protein N8072_00695 [bacterium]|nr:hypothetical protein [bacterium]MDB4128469.1 hypothetical protein [bacterium]MDC1257180.1 hypothetical protein [bacterium]
MTMHLLGPHMTTTKYNSKKSNRKKTAKLAKAEAEHDKFLRKQGVHPDQLAAKKKRQDLNSIPDYKANKPDVKLGNKVAGHGAHREANTYSGERQLLGIATMHKSNMVPIFADRKEDAKDIASMRR